VRYDTKQAFQQILDTFSGADGGISFVLLKTLVEELDQRAESGDQAAQRIVEVVYQFARLINLANSQRENEV